VCETPGCVGHVKCTRSIRRPHLCRVFIERTCIHGIHRTTDCPIARQPSQENPHVSVSHQNTRVAYGHNLCVVPCSPPPWRRCSCKIDTTRLGVPKTRQYATSLLLSSRVPCLRCIFMRTKSQETFENGIWVVTEIRFFLVVFSQPGCYFWVNPNIW